MLFFKCVVLNKEDYWHRRIRIKRHTLCIQNRFVDRIITHAKVYFEYITWCRYIKVISWPGLKSNYKFPFPYQSNVLIKCHHVAKQLWNYLSNILFDVISKRGEINCLPSILNNFICIKKPCKGAVEFHAKLILRKFLIGRFRSFLIANGT